MLFLELDRCFRHGAPEAAAPTPLDRASIPFARGPYRIWADARIDDRTNIVAALGLSASIGDPELALEAYLRWGEACTDHLLGDYAFVIADAERGRIFCARDHVGARPFFYALDGKSLRVCSEIAPLIDAFPELDELDPEFAAAFLASNRFSSASRTFYKNIHKLPAGHSLTLENGSQRLTRYWQNETVAPLRLSSDAEYVDAARSLFETAVADRLRGASRPAVHLSGGLDSTAIAAEVAKYQAAHGASEPAAYAWYLHATDEAADDETRWIAAAQAALGLKVVAPPAEESAIVAVLRADGCKVPAALNLLHENSIQKHASEAGVDTILSGWGGDEGLSFNGRGYQAQLFTSLRWAELAALGGGGPVGLARGLKRGFGEWKADPLSRIEPKSIANTYLAPDLAGSVALAGLPALSFKNPKSAMVSLIGIGGTAERMEDWAISGRAHGIKYAYPLLDRRIMEFALSLPGHMFMRPGVRRWIMRQMLDPKLPDLVRHNSSKLETARVNSLFKIVRPAMMTCADLLESSSDLGPRADFVDIPKLINDLRGPEEGFPKNFSHKRRALQFLLF
ncbi:asparagine synthetase B family protein [Pontixanthobacter aquaemixtae]|uniref:asparagine synthase (glutamine-hydrolyzing) n=1 Tax=Pontixanthobacter aquaemixtae TaxID=1958940 RepID=A0A844ZSW5_9SPHN|nr:asparagine synthase-related protein [Pontixanthobacter aquaemixtae]MXO90818.1 hypothetical protein [Pontixanthobacter aquaemixtae]